MTVIAWDRKTLAADRQGTNADMKIPVPKLRVVKSMDGTPWALATTGDLAGGLMMIDWWLKGADPSAYPSCQNGPDWTRLVAAREDELLVWENHPVMIDFSHLDFIAFGSGRDYAMGAMALGATAYKAVEIASRFDTGCGCGFDFAALDHASLMHAAQGKF